MSVLLSIITVCFNNKDGLIKTIDSVRNQTFKDYEFIVIDGGSTDGSKEVIERNKELFSFWCSEHDGGIYQGMNKGIDHATGEYCLFLNSGDYMANNNVLSNVFTDYNGNSDIVYGNIIRIKGLKKRRIKYSRELSFYDFYRNDPAIHHQAAFIRRVLFLQYGKYREDTYMNADWSFFFLTVVKCNAKTKYVDLTISVCDATGRSHSYINNDIKVQNDVMRKYMEIKGTIPSLVLIDYNRKKHKSNFLKRLYIYVLWHLSVMIPQKIYLSIFK